MACDQHTEWCPSPRISGPHSWKDDEMMIRPPLALAECNPWKRFPPGRALSLILHLGKLRSGQDKWTSMALTVIRRVQNSGPSGAEQKNSYSTLPFSPSPNTLQTKLGHTESALLQGLGKLSLYVSSCCLFPALMLKLNEIIGEDSLA